MSDKHILVIGTGSVGKRHLRNFTSLGCRVSAMDPLDERLHEAASEVNLVTSYASFEKAIDDSVLFDGVVVASPPKYHVSQCIDIIKKGLPVFLEKPISPVLAESLNLHDILEKTPGTKVLVGYTYRWWPPLREFRNQIQSGRTGKLLHAQFVMSAHLADWHPWERYQDFFMASRDLGGGALLDESHFLDLMVWFFGMPEKVFAKVDKLSGLEIETDDNVDLLATYSDGLRVSMHLDLYGRPHEKYIIVEGEGKTLRWSFDPNCVQFCDSIEKKWQSIDFQYERNDMFLNTAREFLTFIDGQSDISCTLQDGINVLRIVEACRKSSDIERVVYMKEIE